MNETSLSNLHDIVLPPSVPLWPPAPAWYVVGVILLLVLSWVAWRMFWRYRRNAYRRAALDELEDLAQQADESALVQISPLLKRTALVAWPRQEVASLSGTAWHRFLAESAGQEWSGQPWAESLERLSYERAPELAPVERADLLAFARRWILKHQPRSS